MDQAAGDMKRESTAPKEQNYKGDDEEHARVSYFGRTLDVARSIAFRAFRPFCVRHFIIRSRIHDSCGARDLSQERQEMSPAIRFLAIAFGPRGNVSGLIASSPRRIVNRRNSRYTPAAT